MEPQVKAPQLWQTQIMLFGALCGTTVIYAGLLLFLKVQSNVPPADVAAMQLPLIAIAVTAGIMSLVLRRKLMPRLGEAAPNGELPTEPLSKDAGAAAMKLNVANILAWGLAEAVAVMGFVLAFLSRDLNMFWPFFGGAAMCLAINRPQKAELLSAIAGAESSP